MSVKAMTWAFRQSTGSASAKVVLLALADHANDDGECWPGIEKLSDKTDLTRRSVITNIQRLIDRGLICRKSRGGDGSGRKSNVHILHFGAKCKFCTLGQSEDGAGQCEDYAGQCEAPSPEPSDKPSINRQRVGRATRIPDDFTLTPERRAVAEAEQVPADRTFETFTDYWRAAAGQKARKHDWDACWRNWCRRQADMQRQNGSRRPPGKTRYDELMEAMDAD